MSLAVTSVVFDIGGVLLDWDPRLVYRDLIPDPEELERFFSEVCTPEWNAGLDAGAPFDQACADLAARHPDQIHLIHAWKRQDQMIAGEVPGMATLVSRLRAGGMPLYLLTNMPADVFEARWARYPVLQQFDGAVVSGQEGVLKPSVEIFNLLAARYGIDPSHSLFVDDLEENIAGALAAGFRAHRFTGEASLASALEDHGVQLGVVGGSCPPKGASDPRLDGLRRVPHRPRQ